MCGNLLHEPVFIMALNHFTLSTRKVTVKKVHMVPTVSPEHIWYPLKM